MITRMAIVLAIKSEQVLMYNTIGFQGSMNHTQATAILHSN